MIQPSEIPETNSLTETDLIVAFTRNKDSATYVPVVYSLSSVFLSHADLEKYEIERKINEITGKLESAIATLESKYVRREDVEKIIFSKNEYNQFLSGNVETIESFTKNLADKATTTILNEKVATLRNLVYHVKYKLGSARWRDSKNDMGKGYKYLAVSMASNPASTTNAEEGGG